MANQPAKIRGAILFEPVRSVLWGQHGGINTQSSQCQTPMTERCRRFTCRVPWSSYHLGITGALPNICLEQIDQLELVEKLLEWELQLKSDPDVARHLRMLDSAESSVEHPASPSKVRGPRP